MEKSEVFHFFFRRESSLWPPSDAASLLQNNVNKDGVFWWLKKEIDSRINAEYGIKKKSTLPSAIWKINFPSHPGDLFSTRCL